MQKLPPTDAPEPIRERFIKVPEAPQVLIAENGEHLPVPSPEIEHMLMNVAEYVEKAEHASKVSASSTGCVSVAACACRCGPRYLQTSECKEMNVVPFAAIV